MAYVYDKLMDNVDYVSWADYLEKLLSRMGMQKNNTILELGCGTGNITVELASRGYDICGLDISADMLAVAREKIEEEGYLVQLFCQPMEQLNLNAKFNCIIIPCDGVNYITSKRDLSILFTRVKKHLTKDGILIFDISSKYKLSDILGNNTFTRIDEELCYIWENSYNSKKCEVYMDLTFFQRQGENYIRFEETHVQRAYGSEEIVEVLNKAGFGSIKVYGDFKFSSPSPKSERIHFTAIVRT